MGKLALRLSTAFTAGVAGLVLLAGTADAQSPQPKKGGTVVSVAGSDPTGLNPTITTDNVVLTAGCGVFEGLVNFNGKTDRPEPLLAESWTISPDGKTYTFKLRDAKWHDGKPLTSEDVRYSYMDVAAKIGPTFSAQVGKILQAIETPDEKTAVFKLSEPYGPLLRLLTCVYSGAVMPSHLYKGTDPIANPVTQKPVGTGPFKFKEWVRGDHITFVRNDDYWDKTKPYLDSVIIRIMPSAAARVQALLAGEVDYIQFLFFPPSDRKTIQSNPKTKLELATLPPNTLFGFFNLKRKPFDDIRVRNALLVATDRKYILDNAFFGSGQEAKAPWAKFVEWAANPDVDYSKSHPFDPEKAGKMLEEAGYKADASGVRFRMKISYDASSAERNSIALMLQSWWKRAGVEVTPDPVENTVLVPRAHQQHDFDFYMVSYNTYGDPAIGIARTYISSTINNPFGNAAGYSNPEVDALFDKAAKLTSIEERAAVYRQIQPILMRDLPAIALHENKASDAASKDLMDAWTYAANGYWATAWLNR